MIMSSDKYREGKMKQWVLSWSSCCPHFLTLSLPSPMTLNKAIFATLNDTSSLTARERRQMRNERRESKPTYNWREEVEERLIKKPKKKFKTWTEDLNLDYLALEGPQWWVVRVSRVTGQETAERLARALARDFPHMEFKVYAPAIQVKRKLKNGTISVKRKPLFPGCVFLRCVLNKEVHDSIRECDGIGGFIGSKVGNTKRQINKPRPVSSNDMEPIFRQAKEEQEKHDQAFEEEQQKEATLDVNSNLASKDVMVTSKPKRRSKKVSEPPLMGRDDKPLLPGSTVRVLSGSFTEFSGTLMKLDRKARMATVGFTLFGKETLADIDANDIISETADI